jgi:hypothetical protein
MPELPELLQENPQMVAVPVDIRGPVMVIPVGSRSAPAFSQVLNGAYQNVLSGLDHKRRRATLIGDGEWDYSHSGVPGSGCRIPADVPVVIEHGDAVYAREHAGAGATVTLAVIVEVWAD